MLVLKPSSTQRKKSRTKHNTCFINQIIIIAVIFICSLCDDVKIEIFFRYKQSVSQFAVVYLPHKDILNTCITEWPDVHYMWQVACRSFVLI